MLRNTGENEIKQNIGQKWVKISPNDFNDLNNCYKCCAILGKMKLKRTLARNGLKFPLMTLMTWITATNVAQYWEK